MFLAAIWLQGEGIQLRGSGAVVGQAIGSHPAPL